METKFKNLQESFYAFSAKTSEVSRQLALGGIAIIWLYESEINTETKFNSESIDILTLFIICLGLDFCHAFVGSVVYGIQNEINIYKKKKEDDMISYSRWLHAPDWLFYVAKVVYLIIAFFKLLYFLSGLLL